MIQFNFQLAQQLGYVAGDLVRRDGLERGQAFTSQQGGTFEGGAHGLKVVVDAYSNSAEPALGPLAGRISAKGGLGELLGALTEAAEACQGQRTLVGDSVGQGIGAGFIEIDRHPGPETDHQGGHQQAEANQQFPGLHVAHFR